MVGELAWFIGNILPYVTLAVFFIVLVYNFLKWVVMPRPLVWSLFPAKRSTFDILLTIGKRIFTLPGPRKVDKTIWVLAWLFHIGLIVSLLLHAKYVLMPTFPAEYYLGSIAGVAAAIGTVGFIIRRIDIAKDKVDSTFADYFALILLIVTLSLGAYLRLGGVVEHETMWAWVQGVLTLNPVQPPEHPLFLIHILLAQIYMMYLPFKTLVHPIAILFGQKIILDERHIYPR
jgi:nitrate reductase gamma subunit